MKIACLIDSLGPGGAERQLAELAVGLRARGHNVALCYYHASEVSSRFFEMEVRSTDVVIKPIFGRTRLDRFLNIRSWLRDFNPDILQAFLPGPNVAAVLAGLPRKPWKTVLSERVNTDYRSECTLRRRMITRCYRFSDWVVTNSSASHDALVRFVPGIRQRCSVIWNSVDLVRFHPNEKMEFPRPFRFLCVASLASRKNVHRLIEALAILRKATGGSFVLKWVGRYDHGVADHTRTMTDARRLIDELGMAASVVFLEEKRDIEEEYRWADALVLVSIREGLPNVICEGMASGLPIVASRVSDIPRIVHDGKNGFLCDPSNPNDIASALENCLRLAPEERLSFGETSRSMAEEFFDREAFVRKYEGLYETLLRS